MRDIHILCDHLEGMQKPHAWNPRRICTHRLTVLSADHWIGADGLYDYLDLFSLDDDLQGQSSRRDAHIRCILHQVAIAVSSSFDLTTFDFLREVDNAKKACMKGNYTSGLNLPKPTGDAIALPVDGGKAVRIKFD